jgi:signal transduction histidine kinase
MSRRADQVWILHADPEARALLRRMAGDPAGAEGSPADFPLEAAPAPRAIVLHVDRNPATAIDFAHRASRMHPRAAWVLLRDPLGRADQAFAGLDAELLAWPAEADQLPRALARAQRGAPTGIRARRQRDALARRFSLTLGDLGLPDLGGLTGGRLLVRGEPGTGRMLVARVVHALADPPGTLVQVDGGTEGALDELASRLGSLGGERVVVCMERPERLSAPDQRELASWVELGSPSSALDPEQTVWIGLVNELAGASAALEPALALALAGREVRLPPLRQRGAAAVRFAAATLRALSAASGSPERRLAPEAQQWIASATWPGNFRELEAVLRRALARGGEGDLGVAELRAAGAPESVRPASTGTERRQAEAAADERSPREARPPARPEPAAPRPAPPQRSSRPAAELTPKRGEARPAARTATRPPNPETTPRAPRDLLQSLAHSLRNPLVSLKTFAALLPEQGNDEEFRGRFRAQAERDLAGLEKHLDRLARYGEIDYGARKAVNVASMLEALLLEHREEIKRRRLLVLSELGADAPWALGSEEALHFAFSALLDATFARIGDRQDLYLACRRPAATSGSSMLRILLRFHGTPLATLPGDEGPAALELVLAEAVFEAFGGSLQHESLESGEQVVRVDLPASSPE